MCSCRVKCRAIFQSKLWKMSRLFCDVGVCVYVWRVSCVFWSKGRGWRLTARGVKAPSDGNGLRAHRDGYGSHVEKSVEQKRGGGAQEPHHCLQVSISFIFRQRPCPCPSWACEPWTLSCMNKRFDCAASAALRYYTLRYYVWLCHANFHTSSQMGLLIFINNNGEHGYEAKPSC